MDSVEAGLGQQVTPHEAIPAAVSATTDAVNQVRSVVLPTRIDRGPAVRKPGPVIALERDTAFLLSCYGYGVGEADYAACHR